MNLIYLNVCKLVRMEGKNADIQNDLNKPKLKKFTSGTDKVPKICYTHDRENFHGTKLLTNEDLVNCHKELYKQPIELIAAFF